MIALSQQWWRVQRMFSYQHQRPASFWTQALQFVGERAVGGLKYFGGLQRGRCGDHEIVGGGQQRAVTGNLPCTAFGVGLQPVTGEFNATFLS